MKLVSTFLLCLFCYVASAQNDTTKYFRSLDYGWSYKRLQAREAFIMPVDTFVNKLGMALLNNKLYSGNGIKWTLINGGTTIDTTKYIKYTDSAAMLNSYLRKIDTASLSNRINLKLNATDTASLSNRINLKIDSLKKSNDSIYTYKNGIRLFAYKDSAGGSNIDTTSLSNRINLKLNATDTASLSNRINLKLNIADTINKFVSNVTKLNDSTITIFKGSTQTNITLSPITTVANATRLITNVYNKSGATITKGSVVYIDGAHSSNLPTIALSKANIEETSAYTYGLVETDITNNSAGVVIQNGSITNLNLPTSTYTDGQTLYLSPTVAGGYTLTKPLAPNHYVAIGTVTRAHPNFGTIQVAIRNGFQLDELSDVQIAAVPNDSTILQFSKVDSLWHDVDPTTAMGNRFVKRTDSSAMLLPYLRKVDTASLSNRINLKLNATDTASLSNRINLKLNATDTASLSNRINLKLNAIDTASLSNRINLKLNISDTSTMLSKYLRKTDTTTLSSRIDAKLAITDTSVFQRKSLASYTFQANNTTATANATSQIFKDTTGTYTGTPTWSGGTAPTTLTNAVFSYTQIGKMVTLRITMIYTNQGATNTRVQIPLMANMPAPNVPSGYSSTADIFGYGYGYFGNVSTSIVAGTTGAAISYIRGTATGSEIVIDRGTSGSGKYVWVTINYFTN